MYARPIAGWKDGAKQGAAAVSKPRRVRWLAWWVAGMLPALQASALIDSNGDGIGDVWAQAYGAGGLDPNGDADRDGMSNRNEAGAGTDPFDAQSGFKVTRIRRVVNGLMLRWQGVAGRTYRVETSPQLGAANWTAGESLSGGAGGDMFALIDRPAAPAAFFRVAAMANAGDFPLGLADGFDSDGDGQSDAAEVLAGTNPFDANSRLAVSEFRAASGWVVEWSTMPGKLYQLQTNQTLAGVWRNEGKALLASGDRLVASIESAGGLGFMRVQVSDVDSDGDGATDWEEWATGLAATRSNSQAGDGSDVATILALLATPPSYAVTALRSSTLAGGNAHGLIEIRRTAGFGPMKIPLVLSGSAVAGVDIAPLSAVATIPLGQSATTLTVAALTGARTGRNLDVAIAGGAHASVTVVQEQAISVKDLGARGDGITDDTAAIQAAIKMLEVTPSINTLNFPAGVYRLASCTYDDRTGRCQWRHLLLGARDLVGRDIFFNGDPGAVLFSDTGAVRTHTLVVDASCRSLSFHGLTWEQGSTPRVGNGADGISLVMHNGRVVEGVEVGACVFRNCHGALFTYGHGYDVRGSLKYLGIHDCQILNPYGANSQHSGSQWGGGVQVGLSEWVGTAVYDHNLFDGGGEDMTNPSTCPGGRLKDGCHFGDPMRLVFSNNVVRHMGVEAVFQTGGNTYMGNTLAGFVMPPVNGSSVAAVTMDALASTFQPGDIVNVRTPGGPTAEGTNNLLYVASFNPFARTLMLRNDGYPGNAVEGTWVAGDMQVYLNRSDEPSVAEIFNNTIDGKLPPGANSDTDPAGIVVNARSRIAGNTLTGFGVGILIYGEALTPLYPASRSTVIAHNTILTRDSSKYAGVYTYGIQTAANDDAIVSNLVSTPTTCRFIGITARALNSRIENNTVISQAPVNNGYTNANRGVGIGFGNQSRNAHARDNTTFGMDVGVGPESSNQNIPHRVSNHRSVNDVLGIDPSGLLPN